MDLCDDDRPTLPYDLSRVPGLSDQETETTFDAETELFMSDVPTQPEFRPLGALFAKDEESLWWEGERRRTLVPWVMATLIVLYRPVRAGSFARPR